MDDDEREEYEEKYYELRAQTLASYRQGEDEDLWTLCQSQLVSLFPQSVDEYTKLAEVAIEENRDVMEWQDWSEAMQRIDDHVSPHSGGIDDYSPRKIAVWTSDEIINHAIAEDIRRELGLETSAEREDERQERPHDLL